MIMAAILASAFLIGRMTEVLAPDIYRAHWHILRTFVTHPLVHIIRRRKSYWILEKNFLSVTGTKREAILFSSGVE